MVTRRPTGARQGLTARHGGGRGRRACPGGAEADRGVRDRLEALERENGELRREIASLAAALRLAAARSGTRDQDPGAARRPGTPFRAVASNKCLGEAGRRGSWR
ncbi:MAG: hypothetical protein F4213_22950 [Boseongicola sp. SB0677_bin_26]|nr:hypothetical protein [Boseongicola sp. SB0677_bin_26]